MSEPLVTPVAMYTLGLGYGCGRSFFRYADLRCRLRGDGFGGGNEGWDRF